MKTASVDSGQVMEALAALREEVRRLGERVAALEAPSPPQPPSPTRGEGGARGEALVSSASPPPSPRPDAPGSTSPGERGSGGAGAEPISEEVLLIISAVIAAFLGKKASIRQIRLVGAAAWAQEGRVTIQASHALTGRQTRSLH